MRSPAGRFFAVIVGKGISGSLFEHRYLVSLDRVTVITIVRESIGMVDWNLALKIFTFGLLAVFCSLGILIAAIYGFGKVLRAFEKD